MLYRVTTCRLACLPPLLLVCLAAISWRGQAQEQNEAQKRETIEVTLPPDRDQLRLRVLYPTEVRVNESFEGQIEVSNLSDKLAFHDIKIGQLAQSKLMIESSYVGDSQGNEGKSKEESPSEKQQQSEQQSTQQQEKFSHVWTIDRLDPGQSRTIHITASSSQQGEVKSCLALVSMTPSLCLSTKFVKPELEIVKQGPDQVSLCEPIVYNYSVKNSGTGAIESFVIHDKLDEGLKTLEGKKELRFEVDGLKAGEVRKFSARLLSSQAGEFASRATAKSESGEEARSNSLTTRVVEPRLALAIDGPDAVYVDRPATYTVRVTNHGQGQADSARVVLRFSEVLSVASVSEPWDTEQKVEQQAQSQSQGKPEQAKPEDQPASQAKDAQEAPKQDQQTSQSDSKQHDEASWDLGELPSGQTKAVRITLNTHRGGKVNIRGEAIAWCGDGDDAQQVAKVAKSQRTEIISLPALALSVVDFDDPVQTDDQVVYRVVVRNEGTSADHNIRVGVTLPEELKFVKATGPTEGKAEGNTVTFEPVKQLGAGEEVSWRVETKASAKGEIALQATLESKGLGKTVKAEEPTTLFTASTKSDSAKQ